MPAWFTDTLAASAIVVSFIILSPTWVLGAMLLAAFILINLDSWLEEVPV